jgi:hypothetical protein
MPSATGVRKPTLASEVKQVEQLARDAGLRRAADWIEGERLKRWRPGPPLWEHGACVWCEAIDGKRRQATHLDIGFWHPVLRSTRLRGAGRELRAVGGGF